MPPKNFPQRRSRKESLQEDLTKLIRDEGNMNDEKVFPILKEALSEGVDVNLVVDGEQTLICYFAMSGMLKCFDECFLLGADPTIVTSEDSIDALVGAVLGLASASTSLRMVMFLLNHVKVADLDHQEAVTSACARGRFEVVRLLLRRNASFADLVLRMAVDYSSIQLVEIALEFKADINQLSIDGRCIIHRAAEKQDSSILKKLLDAGADIEAKNGSIETPFEVAVRFNSVNCVKLLVDRKCDFSIGDALLIAVRCRSHDVLKEFLRDEKLCEEERFSLTLPFAVVASDDLEAFRIVYPFALVRLPVISQLVRFQKYEMLSAALFEFENAKLSTQHLTELIAEAPNDDFKALLQKKIDMMNGVDLVVKVKEEAEEAE